MKKIYIGKTAIKSTRNGSKHQKRSSLHEQKEDLRKRLNYTTHKLEQLETEFDSTRQYLETELRRAQEELEKFTDKLRRIQSSYAALQRINQDLEEKVRGTNQHHEEEKRALSREIIVLNNHLMEAKITIEKLREDNDLYRKDCNLAAQLLQCGKSHYRSHKLSELPVDFQERLSSHMEKQGRGRTVAMCHSPYSDASVPASVIGKVLEKPEPGSSCPVTQSPSPQPQDTDHYGSAGDGVGDGPGTRGLGGGRGGGEHLHRRAAHKTSDLYCSDTALYCPTDERRRERWQERRQSVDVHGNELGLQLLHMQNSTDSNPDEDDGSLSGGGGVGVGGGVGGFHPGFHHHHHHHHSSTSFHDFATAGSLPASSSYSSFSAASDEKVGRGLGSTLSSSQQALYRDWREGGSKTTSSYEKDSPGFPKSRSTQHMAHHGGSPQNGGIGGGGGASSPVYTRTPSCFSEPYHSPHLPSRNASGSSASGALRRDSRDSRGSSSIGVGIHGAEDELSRRWRQLSVEELNAYSYRSPGGGGGGASGRVSPFSFSERHFAISPAKIKLGPLYSSFQEGDDSVFHGRMLDPCFSHAAAAAASASPSPSPKLPHRRQEKGALYRASKDDSQESEGSIFQSGGSKDKGATPRSIKKEYVDASPNSSAESLHQSPHDASATSSSNMHYQRDPHPHPHPHPVPPGPPQRQTPTQYQKFGNTGLSRKDSLTKAQLYGTLLN
ncbi:brain-enriched guanylate kinase-associated protein isoform X2 [Clupea harengus]|uniref:Brain-enriched guanylate kinase-associated protein isoform X2 n=1 Tax=Clupea harengus TaxID=7950 RepID=A0A8M1KT81_CLUHA|nr:brain-enriched guanylate kinase-associated protein isoform X2 [Clupea harengus]